MSLTPTRPVPISPSEITTPDLGERLRRRDTAAFDELVERETPALRRLVARLLGWESDVEDVVQEVLVAAWAKIESYRGESQVSTWLAAIAIRQARKAIRRKELWRRAKGYLRPFVMDVDVTSPATVLEESETAADQRRIMRQAIHRLPQKQREVLVLIYLENNSLESAALLLGIKKNAAEKRASRAKQNLRQMLQNHE